MFGKGDKVVYPMYGAGIIEELEDKWVGGEKRTYFALRIPINNLKILISVENVVRVGIRPILQKDVFG